MSTTATDQATNPVVSTTPLRAYPGWTVRQYQDGMFDGFHDSGVGLTLGESTFGAVVAHIRAQQPQTNFLRRNGADARTRRTIAEGTADFVATHQTPTGAPLSGYRTNWQQLSDDQGGGWGVKLQTTTPSQNAGIHSGSVVEVQARSGAVRRVRLGRCVDHWNAGRSAVYAVA